MLKNFHYHLHELRPARATVRVYIGEISILSQSTSTGYWLPFLYTFPSAIFRIHIRAPCEVLWIFSVIITVNWSRTTKPIVNDLATATNTHTNTRREKIIKKLVTSLFITRTFGVRCTNTGIWCLMQRHKNGPCFFFFSSGSNTCFFFPLLQLAQTKLWATEATKQMDARAKRPS